MSYLPGDILYRRKGPVLHHGIALGNGQVLHNTPRRGEHISTVDEFRAGQRLQVRRRTFAEREQALARAASYRSGRYNLFTNNCEHTTYRLSDDASRSPQLRGWLVGVGAAGATLALTRHPGWAAAALALGRKLGARRYL